MESPGTAPGSEWFITTAIYRHSRLAPVLKNISAKGCRKKTAARSIAASLAGKTPGPNLIIVTLIGYHVAGIAGAVVAITLATARIAWFMRIHPLWAFAAAALLGLAGLI